MIITVVKTLRGEESGDLKSMCGQKKLGPKKFPGPQINPMTDHRRRVGDEFNDRSKFVYLCDKLLIRMLYSLYYEVSADKIWEIEFSMETGNMCYISDYTNLVFPEFRTRFYRKEQILPLLEKLRAPL